MESCHRLLALAAGTLLFVWMAACGGGSGSPLPTGGVPQPEPAGDRVTRTIGEVGGLELTVRGSDVFADATPLVEVVRTGTIVVPEGFTAAGGAVTTSPPGVSFEFTAQLGIPVDPALIPPGVSLDDLLVFQQPAGGGPLQLLPILDTDESTNQVFAAITSLSTFQVAAPSNPFRIVRQENLLEQLGIFTSHQLEYREANGAVTFSLAAITQVSGEAGTDPSSTEPDEDGNFVIAPGIVLTPLGRIYGAAQVAGSWAFTVAATDSRSPEPNVTAISLTLTVMERTRVGIPGFPIDETVWTYASNGDAMVVTNSGGTMAVHRIPADGSAVVSSASLPVGGSNCAVAVHPSGEALVVAFERTVEMTLDFQATLLAQVIRADEAGLVSGLGFDLDGDLAADVTVEFQAAESGFTATEAELNALVVALNEALSTASIPVDAVANALINGIRFVDQGTGYFVSGTVPPAQAPRLLQGGSAIAPVIGTLNTTRNANFKRIFAVELRADMTVIQGPIRIDADPVYDAEEPDTSATMFSRQALRPAVAFAVSPTAETLENDAPYIVAYEVIRNVTAGGGLRSDIHGTWRSFGGGARTLPTRLDGTSLQGDSPGNRVVVAATEAGASVLWIERGGEADSSAGTEEAVATPGELASVEVPVPGVGTPPLAEQSGIGAPAFLNEAETTTAMHPAVTVDRQGQVWVVWTQREDALLNPVSGSTGTAAQTGRGSQSSALLFRRDLSLRAGRVSGGALSDEFQVDVVNNQSSAYSSSIAVSDDGEIAVTWVEAPFNGPQRGYLRRFISSAMPLELPMMVSFPVETIIHYNTDGHLGLVSRSGGDLYVFNFAPEPLVVPAPEE